LVVVKYRGRDFRGGFHDYKIVRGGLLVFPRLVAAEHAADVVQTKLPSGIAALDALLGGGIERGTSTLFVGAPGTGKSSAAIQFAIAAANRGEHAAAFIFDESINTLRTRCAGMGMNLQPHLDSGHIMLRQIDPAELSPGELVHEVREAVLKRKTTVVIIDSLNGYLNAMPNEQFLIVQLHELLTFLGQAGVATLLIGAHHGLIGMQMQTPVDASYLADAVVLLRYFEADGMVRQAISVMKKRGGAHERSIRDFTLSETGIHVGPPLRQFRGILTGVPTVVDEPGRRAP
jgi:circadian clock protein KaiC